APRARNSLTRRRSCLCTIFAVSSHVNLRDLATAVAALSFALLAWSCSSSGGGATASNVAPGSTAAPTRRLPSSSPTAPVGLPPPTPPAAAASAVVLSGAIPIGYVLADPSSAPADVAIAFSLDGGLTWKAASQGPGGDGTVALATQ